MQCYCVASFAKKGSELAGAVHHQGHADAARWLSTLSRYNGRMVLRDPQTCESREWLTVERGRQLARCLEKKRGFVCRRKNSC